MLATWTIKGAYDGQEFTLLPKDGTDIDLKKVQERDTLIRKNKVTQLTPAPQMIFGENFHPFDINSSSELNIISNKEEELKNLGHFINILKDTQVSNTFLSFSLANYLWSKGGNLYPFLEYEFHTSDGSRIADRFYTIQGQGKVGSYNVKLQVQKPTLKQPVLGNFTIIF